MAGSGGLLFLQAEINGAELLEGAVGADLGGADGALEDAGDFGERELLETGEEKDLAILAVEAGERGVKERVIVAAGRVVRGVRRIVGVFEEVDGIGGVRGGVGLAEMIGGATAGEVIHPGAEAAVVAVGVAVFQHPLENDLRDVFGRGAVAGKLVEEAEERTVVTLEKLAERIEVAVADGEHQVVVGSLIGGGVHGEAAFFNHGRGRMDTDFVEGGDHGGTCVGLAGKTGGGRESYPKCFSIRKTL